MLLFDAVASSRSPSSPASQPQWIYGPCSAKVVQQVCTRVWRRGAGAAASRGIKMIPAAHQALVVRVGSQKSEKRPCV